MWGETVTIVGVRLTEVGWFVVGLFVAVVVLLTVFCVGACMQASRCNNQDGGE